MKNGRGDRSPRPLVLLGYLLAGSWPLILP